MRTISRDRAFKEVRDSLSAVIYEKRESGWRKYTHGFGGTLDCEDIDGDEVPSEVKAERKAAGCSAVYHDGFFKILPIVGDMLVERTVIIRDERSDVAAAGEFVAGLVKGFFR